MDRRKMVIGAAIVVAGGIGWALFRPDLLFINKTANEAFPVVAAEAASRESAPKSLATGQFRGYAHRTDGAATIYRLPDGKRVLRLTDFATSNGPELHVYLVAARDAMDNATVKKAGFIDLGPLKGNKGDQNYDVPAEADLSKHRAVTIWCRRFGVNFATAPLREDTMSASTMDSSSMDTGPKALARGTFQGYAHRTDGTATVYALPDGKRVLRLMDFATSNGPELHVYMVAAPDAKDNATVKKAGFIDLGSLKGNKGDQNYEVPAGVDLSKHRAVTIWCRRFGVNFATAPLTSQQS